jgi:hypothetical protein
MKQNNKERFHTESMACSYDQKEIIMKSNSNLIKPVSTLEI